MRHSKREKKKVKALVEEIAKKTDLPENKIHDVIAKVNKANKTATALAKAAVELPAEDPTRQSERLKEQVPVQKEKKQRVRRKEVYFKTHKLTKEERKERRDARRKAHTAIDLEQGFAKGHLTRDVEDTGLDDFFKWATLKKNLTKEKAGEKKKRAMEKISAFGGKIPTFAVSGRSGWEGNLGLKTAKIMKEYWKKKKAKPKKATTVKNLKRKRESASTIAGIAHAAKIADMISEHHKNKKARVIQDVFKKYYKSG